MERNEKRVCTSLKVMKKRYNVLDVIGVEITLSFDLLIWFSQFLLIPQFLHLRKMLSSFVRNIQHLSCTYVMVVCIDFLVEFFHIPTFSPSLTWLFWCSFMVWLIVVYFVRKILKNSKEKVWLPCDILHVHLLYVLHIYLFGPS